MQQPLQAAFLDFKNNLEQSLADLQQLDHRVLNHKPAADKWSCAQIMLHINLSITGTLNYLQKKLQKPELIETTGFSASLRSALLNAALRSNIKFKAPKGLDNLPETATFSEIAAITHQNIALFTAQIDHFPVHLIRKNVFKHPVAGRLTMLQTIGFLNEHILHHRRQMEQIIKIAG